MNIRFDGKVVVITGGSTGIGAAVAKQFGFAGANVVVNYNKSEQEAMEVVEIIQKQGGKSIAVQADVSKAADVKQLFSSALDTFGRIDILFNNAGSLLGRGSIEELSEDLWDQVYDLNVKSVFLCSQSVIPIMKEIGGGVIINTASIAGRNGGGGGSVHYASAKGAVITFTKGLAKELSPYGIRVVGINPGVITTPFHDRYTPNQLRQNLKNTIPMGREGTPEECAGAVIFLASSYASYINGEVIEINGAQLTD